MTSAWNTTVPGGESRSVEGRGVLAGAFQLLDTLVDLSEAGLTAVAAASGLPKATAHRLLEQLLDLGAVERRGSRYRVGHRMFRVGQTWQPYPGLGAAAHGPIKALARASGADVAICVLRQGNHDRRWRSWRAGRDYPTAVGMTVPWPSAAGKVLVAVTTPGDRLPHLTKGLRRAGDAITAALRGDSAV